MKDIKSLMDYFIGVNDAHGEGYSDSDIDSHLRLFCEQIQAKINHPFSDGGPEIDYDDYRWRAWRDGCGAHVSHAYVKDGDKEYDFVGRVDNLTSHDYSMEWFNHIHRDPSREIGLRFMLLGAVVDLADEASIGRCFSGMRNTVKNIKGTRFVLEQLKRDDVWDYFIPNIIVSKR